MTQKEDNLYLFSWLVVFPALFTFWLLSKIYHLMDFEIRKEAK